MADHAPVPSTFRAFRVAVGALLFGCAAATPSGHAPAEAGTPPAGTSAAPVATPGAGPAPKEGSREDGDSGQRGGPNGAGRLGAVADPAYVVGVKLALDTPKGSLTAGLLDVELGELVGDRPVLWQSAVHDASISTYESEIVFEPGSRVLVRGKLPNGDPFQHLLTSLAPSPYRVSARASVRFWAAERSQIVPMVVENHGERALLELSVQGSPGLEASISPAELELDQGGHATALLRVEPSASSEDAFARVTVERQGQSADRNDFVVRALVRTDQDGDGLADATEGAGPVAEDPSLAAFEIGGRRVAVLLPPGISVEGLEILSPLEIASPSGVKAPYGGFELRLSGKSESPPAAIEVRMPGVKDVGFGLVPPAAGARFWARRGRFDPARNVLQVPLTASERTALKRGTLVFTMAPGAAR